MRVISVIFLIVCFTLSGNSQDTFRNPTFSIAPLGGVILPHHPNMKYLVTGHIPGVELDLSFSTDSSKSWYHAYNFPTWGMSLTGYNLQSPHLGYAAALRAFYDLPLTRNRALGLKLGIGVAYVEKPFDLDENFHNSAIGSHANVAIGINFYGRVKLSQNLEFKPGIGIHHFSNGAITIPNAGINLAMLRLQLAYSSHGFNTPQRIEKPFEKTKITLFAGTSFGVKQIPPIGSKRYGVANLFATAQKRVSEKSTFGLELGINYNSSLQHREVGLEKASENAADNIRPFLSGQYQLNFDPVAVRFQVGSYLFPRFDADGMIFLRYHLVYNFNRWQAFIGLKSHYAKADNGELGIAYKLR